MNKAPRYFIWDYILAISTFMVCTGPIISKLTMYFGFSLALSNLINGFTIFLPIVQMAGSIAYGMAASPVHFLRHTNGIWRLYFPLVFLSVLLPPEEGKWMMVISYMLAVGILQFALSPQTSWMSSCVDGQAPANYYARRETSYMMSFTVLFCVFSLVIDYAEKQGKLQNAFVLTGIFVSVMMLLSLSVMLRIPKPPTKPRRTPDLKALLEPFYYKEFKKVIASNVAWNFSVNFSFCFAMLYQVQVLKLSFFTIMLWTTAANLVRTAGTVAAGKMAERMGWPRVDGLSCVIMAVACLIWALTNPQNARYLYPAGIILCTLPYSGLAVGFMKTQLVHSPEDNRSIYVAVLAFMGGVAALAGSLISSSLLHFLEKLSTPRPEYIFYIGIAVSLLAAAACVRVPDCEEGRNEK